MEEEAHIEHIPVQEGPAIGRHPLIPCDGLASLKDLFDVSIEPTLRRWSGKLSEGRLGDADLMFGESEDEDEERYHKERDRKEPKHLF